MAFSDDGREIITKLCLCIDIQQDRDLSNSSSNVSDLNARLKKTEQLIGELRAAAAELKRTNTESGIEIAELKRNIEHFKSKFSC